MNGNISSLIERLSSKDPNDAYQALLNLLEESKLSPSVYKFFGTFVPMINDSNSYIRTRGLLLIAANAKWDTDNRIDGILDEYMKHIVDEKPITARQVIKALAKVAFYKPALAAQIKEALRNADTSSYNGNMRPLVDKDIATALQEIK